MAEPCIPVEQITDRALFDAWSVGTDSSNRSARYQGAGSLSTTGNAIRRVRLYTGTNTTAGKFVLKSRPIVP